MLLPRKDAETVEDAIERRLEQTMVSGGVRPFKPVSAVRKSSNAESGLFLVKPAVGGHDREIGSSAERMRGFRGPRVREIGVQPAEDKKTRGRVISMRLPNKPLRPGRFQERMVGPLLEFGYAALKWLRVL